MLEVWSYKGKVTDKTKNREYRRPNVCERAERVQKKKERHLWLSAV